MHGSKQKLREAPVDRAVSVWCKLDCVDSADFVGASHQWYFGVENRPGEDFISGVVISEFSPSIVKVKAR